MQPVEEPPPPPLLAPGELVEEVSADLVVPGCTRVAATDGSSQRNVGASGFVLPTLGVKAVCGPSGEDQGPYKAELLALLFLFEVLLAVPFPQRAGLTALHVLSDCESAITAVEQDEGKLPLLVKDVAHARAALRHAGICVRLHWIPSHGKESQRWQPRSGAQRACCRV